MKSQLELTFDRRAKPATFTAQPRSQRRHQRARWWFDQMRQVVDRALDRNPAPAPRPEQIYLSLRQQPGTN